MEDRQLDFSRRFLKRLLLIAVVTVVVVVTAVVVVVVVVAVVFVRMPRSVKPHFLNLTPNGFISP